MSVSTPILFGDQSWNGYFIRNILPFKTGSFCSVGICCAGGVLISPHLYGFYFTLRKVEIHVLQCVCCRIADSPINLQNWLFFAFVSLAQSSAI